MRASMLKWRHDFTIKTRTNCYWNAARNDNFLVVIKSFPMQKSVKISSVVLNYGQVWSEEAKLVTLHIDIALLQFRIANWFYEASNNYFLSSWTMTFSKSFLVITASEKKIPITERNQFHVNFQTSTKDDVSQHFFFFCWDENSVNRFQIIRLFIE